MTSHRPEAFAWFFLEPAVTIVVAVVLYFPLNKKDLAELTAIFGALLVIANLAQTLRLRREFDMVAKLAEVADLNQSTSVDDIREVLRLYLAIREPELAPLKNDAIEGCTTSLAKLAYDKVSADIMGGDYHIWLNVMMTNSKKKKIRAVSVMDESEWLTSPAEKKFLEANVMAARRGMQIDRIFITNKKRMGANSNQEVINQHVRNTEHGLTAHIVWEEDLVKHDPSLLQEVGSGFISFDDRVALVDVAVPPEEARGVVTMNTAQLRSLRRLFDRLMLHAQPVTAELSGDSGQTVAG
jgi:hypothetical protein